MSDLISRQDAIDALAKGNWGVEWDKALAEAIIKNVPSAQPERKKGEWMHDPDPDAGLGWYTCSECGHNGYEAPDFCPCCGADLRGEEDE